MASSSQNGRWTPLSLLAIVAGFIIWWPIGLVVLAYVLWAGPVDGIVDDGTRWLRGAFGRNAAPEEPASLDFDAYKAETLRRLETEEAERALHLDRLRHAQDRAEFDRLLAEYERRS